MKTKIIYISGNEVFNIADIHSAFEAVRTALNLDKDTVLFGVPVDQEDAGFANRKDDQLSESTSMETYECINESVDEEIPQIQDEIPTMDSGEQIKEKIEESKENDEAEVQETPVSEEEAPVKKRGRSRKEKITEEIIAEEPTTDSQSNEEKIVPILSVLSSEPATQESESIAEADTTDANEEQIEIVQTEEIVSIAEDIDETKIESFEDTEPDLEKLLSEMTPLHEDIVENESEQKTIQDSEPDINDEDSVDATLEQLAAEFAESQDKIATETKHSTRSKIGKLRNILPFKQSKRNKDQGLGDLFGWAGVAANDEDFSVPGFFTNAVGKK